MYSQRKQYHSNFLRNALTVLALNTLYIACTKLQMLSIPAPKHDTDLLVGSWIQARSSISGGTTIPRRELCFWTQHSSRLHCPISMHLFSRVSFLYSPS